MTDWDRSAVDDRPPTASQVYTQLGIGCATAFCASIAMATASLVLAGLYEATVGGNGLGFAAVGVGVLAIGLTQWIWLVPLALATFRRRRAVALGLVIGGVMIAMLNGTCVGMFATI
jgi:hypothetical protein